MITPTLTIHLLLGTGVIHPAKVLDLTAEADLLDCATANGCRFNGVQEGFGAVPATLYFTDTRPGWEGTFPIPLDGTPAVLRGALASQREAFARHADGNSFFQAADRA